MSAALRAGRPQHEGLGGFRRVLKAAGTNFGILGTEETCCGEPLRRIGNEYLYQMQAQSNIETFKNYGVKKIVTTCPHCFNTLKNEYPQFGGEFEVIHHTQFLGDLDDCACSHP
jgi:Fe-S oxidoreductase